MNSRYTILFRRYSGNNNNSDWLSIECMMCNHIIWSGEESWWAVAKLYVHQFFQFIDRHECNSHK